jgi:ribosomal protein S18 acetylase RimI-like enzyme
VDADTPEISVGVAADWRGRGVGRALLDALVATARESGHDALSLSVDRRNAAALALYRSIGFVQTIGGSAENPTMLLRLVG